MKKLLVIIQLVMGVALYSSYASADDHHHHGHGWDHHHHHPDRVYYRDVVRYYPAPRPVVREVVKYYPAPRPVVRYYPQPAPVYYPPAPQYQSYAPSTNGLAGGVIGSVFGYQLGAGDPLATGIGAAAGSYLGNGVVGR